MPFNPDQTFWLISIKGDVLRRSNKSGFHPYLKDDIFDPNRFAMDLFDVVTLSDDTPFWVCDAEMKRDIITHNLIPNTFNVTKFRSLFDLLSCDTDLYIGCKEEVNRTLTDEEHTLLRQLIEMDD